MHRITYASRQWFFTAEKDAPCLTQDARAAGRGAPAKMIGRRWNK
jgi:hypothetical protein